MLRDYGDYVPIAMWGTPPFSLHSNFPISSIKDLKGKKVRGSGIIQIESLKSLGAVPVGMPPTEVPEALARQTIDASTSQPAVLFDFGLDRVTSHHYFVRLGVVPLAVVMNRKSFDALPKAAQDAIRSHSLEWINKLYVDSMLVYDKSPHRSAEVGPQAHRGVSRTRRTQQAAQTAFEPVIQAWVAKSPRNARNLQVCDWRKLRNSGRANSGAMLPDPRADGAHRDASALRRRPHGADEPGRR